MREYFDELRQPLSSGCFGNVGKRQIMVELLRTHEPNPLMNGPLIHERNTAKQSFDRIMIDRTMKLNNRFNLGPSYKIP